MATLSDFTANRPVEGRVKNLLDDLAALDAKIPDELARGVRENYLEQGKVASLAEKLKVPAPRFRRNVWVYVEHRQIQSVQVQAYDEEDALRIFREQYDSEIQSGAIPYGFRRSHWQDRTRGGVMISVPTTDRPRMDHNLPFYVQRREEPRPLRPEPEQVPEPTPVLRSGDSLTVDSMSRIADSCEPF